METHAPRRDQRNLCDKEDDPQHERNGMDMHEQVRERGSKQADEKVRAGKADQYDDHRDDRHSREEDIIRAEIQILPGSRHKSSTQNLGRRTCEFASEFYMNLAARLAIRVPCDQNPGKRRYRTGGLGGLQNDVIRFCRFPKRGPNEWTTPHVAAT